MRNAVEELVNESRQQGYLLGIDLVIKQGFEQGLEQGFEQGLKLGAAMKEKSMYEKLLEYGQTVQQIAALFEYTVEYVQSVLSGKTK